MALWATLTGLLLIWLFAGLDKIASTDLVQGVETRPETATRRTLAQILAFRLVLLAGFALLSYGWVSVLMPAYNSLRAGGVARMPAGLLLYVLPLTMISTLAWWLGILVAENWTDSFTRYGGWARYLAWPFLPVGYLAAPRLDAPAVNGEDESDERLSALRAMAAQPDPVWQMVQDRQGNDVAVANRQIFDNAAELPSVRLRECMVPRTDVVAVEEEDGIEGLRKAFIESGYSKIPVYRETIDNVVGYCHSSALFKKPKQVSDILTNILMVPETMSASQLLVEFSKAKKSIAMVIDEFGGTSGLVTMEDVMEEIFGDIRDELDDEELTEVAEADGQYLLSARLEVDYLNEKYGWDLPVGDYESLGGLVISLNQDLPEKGQVIEAPPFTFEIVDSEEKRVNVVRIRVSEELT